jgi:GNAT superfamily N-acetyltransferase
MANMSASSLSRRSKKVTLCSRSSCFYVRIGYRRQGITSHLIAAALKAAKRAKAPALEAYPLDADLTPSASGTGYASTFVRAGFQTVVRRVPPRPIMRYDLKAVPR